MPQTFEEKLAQQLNYLHTNIISGNNSKFKIFNLEAGLGKSIQAEKSMVDAYLNHGKKTLYVCQFKDTGEENTIHDKINKLAGKVIAQAVDASNKNDIKNHQDIPILIITHEKYKQLSYNTTERKKFTEGRYNLIIDEMPNMVNIFIYTKDRIEQMCSIFGQSTLASEYKSLVSELEDCLLVHEHIRNKFFNTKKKYKRKLGRLKTLIQTNIDKEKFTGKTLNLSNYNFETSQETKESINFTKAMLLEEIEILNNFYTNTCCVDRGSAYTYDNRIQYFTLSNNIILDANGGFQELYNLDKRRFNNSEQLDKIVDHSNWTLYCLLINTNTSAKSRYSNFDEFIQDTINTDADDKTLLVSSKQHKDKFANVEKAHFGNIIGKNTWRDYNKIFIVHNPQTPFYVYALKYLYYSNMKMDNRSSWDIKLTDGTMKFESEYLDTVRVSDLCGHIYQAIKRINRDNSQESKVYLFNSDIDVISMVSDQMSNISIKHYELSDEIKKNKKDKELHNQTFSNKFIVLLDGILQGEHRTDKEYNKLLEYNLPSNVFPKQWCMDKMEYKTPKHFSTKILKHLDVIQFMQNNKFISKGRNIVLLK